MHDTHEHTPSCCNTKMTGHQKRLWQNMIEMIQKYLDEKTDDFIGLVGKLEGTFDSSDIRNVAIIERWYDLWTPLETRRATEGHDVYRQKAVKELTRMKEFLLSNCGNCSDDFQWLQKWYLLHCNGDWEHGNGVHIGTIDNPGWSLKIELLDTEPEGKEFKETKEDKSGNDWIFCRVKDGKFEGFCGPENLPQILGIFRDWTES